MVNKNTAQQHKKITDNSGGVNEDKSNVVSELWKEKRNYTIQFKKKSKNKNTGARRASSPDAETAELEKRARDWTKRVDAALQKEEKEHRLKTDWIKIGEHKREHKRLRQEIERME